MCTRARACVYVCVWGVYSRKISERLHDQSTHHDAKMELEIQHVGNNTD